MARAAQLEEDGVPPEELRFRVGGFRDVAQFISLGRQCRDSLAAALAQQGKDFGSFARILDFGCGCGRTLIAIAESWPLDRFHGTDIDAEVVAWCRAHLPLASCAVNDALPPLDYSHGAFDLVYSISVFTHLNEEYQFIWLEELRRVTAPGGLVLLSVHGETCRNYLMPEKAAEIERAGCSFQVSDAFAGMYPAWYQMTFHTEGYVREQFTRYFDLLAYLPAGLASYQDLVVLRRR